MLHYSWESGRNVNFVFEYSVHELDTSPPKVQVGVMHQAGPLSQPGNF